MKHWCGCETRMDSDKVVRFLVICGRHRGDTAGQINIGIAHREDDADG